MSSIAKTGILLVNLGTPDSPSVPDVRKYLREFLMDGRVIDFPFLPRWVLVNLIIAPFRAPKSAKIYQELWDERGSPLKYFGHDIEKIVQERLSTDQFDVKLAMRYQSPSIDNGLAHFRKIGVKKIIVVPFFPQYASASSGSVYEKVMEIVSKWQTVPEIQITGTFFDHPKYIEHFTQAAQNYMEQEKYDYFLFSYHGIPERQIRKGDHTGTTCKFGSCCEQITPDNRLCYRAQCFETTRQLAKSLNLKEGSYSTAFQSRLGRDPWIKPYTDKVIEQLPKQGIAKVLAFSPSFVSDCLETTIEVGEEYKEIFEENGGKHWQLVESLNNSPLWADLILDLIGENKTNLQH